MSEHSANPANGEIASWMAAWQEPDPDAESRQRELAARIDKVKKSSRRFGVGLLVLTISELVFCLGVLIWGLFWVLVHPEPWRWVLLGLATVLVVVAEVFVLRNRRGTYRPRNQTTQAFIELEWLRTQRQLRTIRFFVPFLAVEIGSIFCVRVWELTSHPGRADKLPQFLQQVLLVSLLLLTAIGAGTWVWYRRILQKIRELEGLRAAFLPASDRLEGRPGEEQKTHDH